MKERGKQSQTKLYFLFFMLLAKLMVKSCLNFLDWLFEVQRVVFILQQGDECGYKTEFYKVMGV